MPEGQDWEPSSAKVNWNVYSYSHTVSGASRSQPLSVGYVQHSRKTSSALFPSEKVSKPRTERTRRLGTRLGTFGTLGILVQPQQNDRLDVEECKDQASSARALTTSNKPGSESTLNARLVVAKLSLFPYLLLSSHYLHPAFPFSALNYANDAQISPPPTAPPTQDPIVARQNHLVSAFWARLPTPAEYRTRFEPPTLHDGASCLHLVAQNPAAYARTLGRAVPRPLRRAVALMRAPVAASHRSVPGGDFSGIAPENAG
ncbi:hypothetical protein B0H16DRAFT_1452532 [Mycena metata]|uniref:Uncharacterized protein n=1 Tax=Mycena metata TaxID=1033252 RepID=A0AAD7NNV3_9AGAR|nr:hypothetical protein B0H16DRAFT_1452532 [Mycena metata]